MTQAQRSDKMRWRATYGQIYPDQVVEVRNESARPDLSNVKVWFRLKKKTLEKARFVSCQFHIERLARENERQTEEVNQLEIQELTFRGCHFDRTFLGGAAYVACRFVDCSFDTCDFGSSKFVDCVFTDCRFTDCTGWNTLFARTIIDPTSFMTGLQFPERNYQGVERAERKNDLRKYRRTRLDIANQILGSLANTNHSDYFDRALYYCKCFDFWNRVGGLRDWERYQRLHRSTKEAACAYAKDFSRLAFSGLNLVLTKGGTSIFRLLIAFVIANAVIFPFLVAPNVEVRYQDTNTGINALPYSRVVAGGVELFLSYGYTNFKPVDLASHVAIASYTALGIMWYAFLIPVLLRRIYK